MEAAFAAPFKIMLHLVSPKCPIMGTSLGWKAQQTLARNGAV
jgi:hypothetical protein